MKRLGVIGTMVWDRIHARDIRAAPVDEWGGIAYALAAASAAAPGDWYIVPLLKVGADLAPRAGDFLRALHGVDSSGVREVAEPNNRVELRYVDRERRCERLTGGVPPWRFDELEPLLSEIDALYINFISGFELDLETAWRVRVAFQGPIYADLHSLFMGVGAGGLRFPQPLDGWREWLRCFDIVQVNDEELALLAGAWGDPWRFAAETVGPELRLLLVTLGERGSAYVASSAFGADPLGWHRRGLAVRPRIAAPGAARTQKVPLRLGELVDGDPTGCGDVWGATAFLALLGGTDLNTAMLEANSAAALNARHRGATGLDQHLRGRIHT
ncbi:MAG: carbohydrate kinase family protein [Longimicrobiales bacterium]